jgi:hypothetical protein
MQAVSQRLVKAGLPIEEFPQTTGNLTAASQNLFDLIESQSLIVYPDAGMRLAVSRAVAKESVRGWRIAKERQSHKIDVVVALAMACHAAVQGLNESNYDRTLRAFQPDFIDEDIPPQRRAAAQPQSPAPPRADADWWRSMPQRPAAEQRAPADQRLADLYGAINSAIAWGMLR